MHHSMQAVKSILPSWQRLMQQSCLQAEQIPGLSKQEIQAIQRVTEVYPMRINAYFLEQVLKYGTSLAKQVIPDGLELDDPLGMEDPLAEESNSPVPNITHRYPDRVLFTVCNECAVYCRFCTRKRKIGKWPAINQADIENGIDYIRQNSNVKDVLLSGGDPLLLSDNRLDWLLSEIHEIDHVDIVRIGTRVPGVLPQRITKNLVEVLSKHPPLYMNLHFNHPAEITEEVKSVCNRMADAGLVLGSQTVLLRGINDSDEIIGELMRKLIKIRVKPYYLMQGDLTKGTDHFRTSVEVGIDIIKALRGRISGMAIPTLVLDLPGGKGKVPLSPDYVVKRNDSGTCFINYLGETVEYPDPAGWSDENKRMNS